MYFCTNCGQALKDGARFCINCGAAVEEDVPIAHCTSCGVEMPADAVFCPFCGRAQTAQTADPYQTPQPLDSYQTAQTTDPYQTVQPLDSYQTAQTADPYQTAQTSDSYQTPQPSDPYQTAQTTDPYQTPQTDPLSAVPLSAAVDFTAQELSFELSGFAGAALEEAIPIAGPIRTAFGGLKTLFTNIGGVGSSKKALISAILAFVAWTAIGLWNRSGFGNDLSQTLSTILYAQGGTKGTAAQIAGGILGKGVVMTAVLSLFSGGFIATFKGIGKLFGRGLALGTLIAGLGTAVLFHQLLAGFTGLYGTAVAVSGAVLSLQALSGRFGFLRSMAVSLTSRKADKVRSENPVGTKSFLTGLTLGMALSGALSVLLPLPWWIGGIFVVIGILIQVVLGRKEAKV